MNSRAAVLAISAFLMLFAGRSFTQYAMLQVEYDEVRASEHNNREALREAVERSERLQGRLEALTDPASEAYLTVVFERLHMVPADQTVFEIRRLDAPVEQASLLWNPAR